MRWLGNDAIERNSGDIEHKTEFTLLFVNSGQVGHVSWVPVIQRINPQIWIGLARSSDAPSHPCAIAGRAPSGLFLGEIPVCQARFHRNHPDGRPQIADQGQRAIHQQLCLRIVGMQRLNQLDDALAHASKLNGLLDFQLQRRLHRVEKKTVISRAHQRRRDLLGNDFVPAVIAHIDHPRPRPVGIFDHQKAGGFGGGELGPPVVEFAQTDVGQHGGLFLFEHVKRARIGAVDYNNAVILQHFWRQTHAVVANPSSRRLRASRQRQQRKRHRQNCRRSFALSLQQLPWRNGVFWPRADVGKMHRIAAVVKHARVCQKALDYCRQRAHVGGDCGRRARSDGPATQPEGYTMAEHEDDIARKAAAKVEGFFNNLIGGGFRAIVPLIALAILLLALFRGHFGLQEIEPGQVAVLYNTTDFALFGDDRRVIREQGTIVFMPWFQRLEVMDTSPQILIMEGDEEKERDTDPNHAKRLTVRANDGSNFWFPKLEIHYQLDPTKADLAIELWGRGDAFKWQPIKSHAREILRNEFGRYTFLEAANPGNYSKATSLGKTTLNSRLAPTGIDVTQIITPKPSFDVAVETDIRDRQTAEQAVQVLAKKRDALEQAKQRKVQDVKQEKNAELQTLIATLSAQYQQVQNSLVDVRRESDIYATAKKAEGQAKNMQKVAYAAAQEEAARERAQGLAAKVAATGAQGAGVLNLTIAENIFPQLNKLTASPYYKSSMPFDLRTTAVPAGK